MRLSSLVKEQAKKSSKSMLPMPRGKIWSNHRRFNRKVPKKLSHSTEKHCRGDSLVLLILFCYFMEQRWRPNFSLIRSQGGRWSHWVLWYAVNHSKKSRSIFSEVGVWWGSNVAAKTKIVALKSPDYTY